MRRSFWLLVLVALLVEGVAAWLAWRGAVAQLPCHLAGMQVAPGGFQACVQQVPLVGRRPWVPALAVGVVVAASVGLAGYELARQLLRLRRLRVSLRALGGAPPAAAEAVASAGLASAWVVRSEEALCFCLGLLRPKVVVSNGLVALLGPEELGAALAHEGSHQRRRDPLRLLVATVAARGLFFVPALGELGRSARLATEVDADTAAASRCGQPSLLRALRAVLGTRLAPPSGVSAMVTSDLLPERVAALGGEPPRLVVRRLRLAGSLLALGVVLVLGLVVPSGTVAPLPLPVHRVPVHSLPAHSLPAHSPGGR